MPGCYRIATCTMCEGGYDKLIYSIGLFYFWRRGAYYHLLAIIISLCDWCYHDQSFSSVPADGLDQVIHQFFHQDNLSYASLHGAQIYGCGSPVIVRVYCIAGMFGGVNVWQIGQIKSIWQKKFGE